MRGLVKIQINNNENLAKLSLIEAVFLNEKSDFKKKEKILCKRLHYLFSCVK